MLYVSFIHSTDILPIAASATTNQLESVHDAISSTTRSANAYTPYSLIACQTSATECSKQAIRYHSMNYAALTVGTALITATMDGAITRGYTKIGNTIPLM